MTRIIEQKHLDYKQHTVKSVIRWKPTRSLIYGLNNLCSALSSLNTLVLDHRQLLIPSYTPDTWVNDCYASQTRVQRITEVLKAQRAELKNQTPRWKSQMRLQRELKARARSTGAFELFVCSSCSVALCRWSRGTKWARVEAWGRQKKHNVSSPNKNKKTLRSEVIVRVACCCCCFNSFKVATPRTWMMKELCFPVSDLQAQWSLLKKI